ncbi:hypothetical protein IMZ31_19250 (plasmid) [Pontibacillus sp. ALD_SL1]|nr:hypothetical protein IMZ31_19250 [Pontibacillus sp. ALD_SL1]
MNAQPEEPENEDVLEVHVYDTDETGKRILIGSKPVPKDSPGHQEAKRIIDTYHQKQNALS